MSISRKMYAEKTYYERMQLWDLLASGMPEWQAISHRWPLKDDLGQKQNSSRIAKLSNWKKYSVWPPSEEEILKAQESGLLKNVLDIEEIRDIFGQLRYSLTAFPVNNQDRHRHLERQHVGFRAPSQYVQMIERLGGTKTEHLLAAIDLYLRTVAEKGITSLRESVGQTEPQ